MHFVHTVRRFGAPATVTRIFWTLGSQRRRVRLCECEMLFPNPGFFPQMSHTAAITAVEVTKYVPVSDTTTIVGGWKTLAARS
ncbi:hypothetical protein BH24ACT26_BH24ACT26_19510 [soil metagenome]